MTVLLTMVRAMLSASDDKVESPSAQVCIAVVRKPDALIGPAWRHETGRLECKKIREG
jgi:hypothetical protein